MIRWRRSQGVAPIAVTIEDGEVRVAQRVSGGGGATHYETAMRCFGASSPVLSGPWLMEAQRGLREALTAGSFVGRRAVSCLPAGLAPSLRVSLPEMPDAELGEASRWRVAKELSLSGDSIVTDYLEVGPDEPRDGKAKRNLMVFAAKRDDVDAYAGLFNGVGLVLSAIDAFPTALGRSLAAPPRGVEPPEVDLVLCLNHQHSQIVCFRGDAPFYIQQLPSAHEGSSGKAAHPPGDERAEPDAGAWPVRALCRHVEMCLHHVADRHPGGGAPGRVALMADEGEADWLSKLNGSPGLSVCPLRDLWPQSLRDAVDDGSAAPPDSSWGTVLGLASYDAAEDARRAA